MCVCVCVFEFGVCVCLCTVFGGEGLGPRIANTSLFQSGKLRYDIYIYRHLHSIEEHLEQIDLVTISAFALSISHVSTVHQKKPKTRRNKNILSRSL